jgi:hypothetical protein
MEEEDWKAKKGMECNYLPPSSAHPEFVEGLFKEADRFDRLSVSGARVHNYTTRIGYWFARYLT